ncbi:TPA: GspE/PulE family protein [Photobacterium damselae]|uniref:GspE/PulE family protein n=1 Tax=Photobacterium damselae TaxID=38293 RepID=UPI00083A35D8|nr:GspE/PulE family protein [Photobacterium damselae]MCG3824516.1 type II/IV secretion system protein [Photobacterium damselae]NVH46235.1 type II/IV secretion system protein [Photobacterium damselae subsp. damselae]ODA25140.1 MSHA biogenesis protein MshE [Photobacterium damselae subsp. damselae]TLS71611.1 type II/IV secretion system protein [Photobacterium damselae subsp. damselae]TLS75845.1 type II/IV secretion system protein [Photobacterium damselae subsp. damselae]
MSLRLRKRLGDLLVEENIIAQSELEQALAEQHNTGRKLGDTLISMGFISEQQMLEFLSRQLGIPLVNLSRIKIDSDAVSLLSEVHARRLRALAIGRNGDTVRVAMSDPADLTAQEAVYDQLHGYQVELVIASETQLLAAFDRYYRRTKEIASFAEQLKAEHQVQNPFSFGFDEAVDNDEVTVVKLINTLFEDAIQVGASDIHIEPDEDVLRIRQRIDGVLHETVLQEKSIASALVLRLKLMSGLDISEKRLPQDGRFNIKVKDHSVDIRISTMPVQHGESVVMRLLDQSAGILSLEQVGMPAEILTRFRRQLKRLHGMILVTGPTGSGKTTTLYGALNELNLPGKKLITAEDPVEYRLPRVNQVQVNSKIGLSFSSILRTVLRQDPDVILVGEMRDHETVEIGLRSALTGHLVLSTLHTNNAIDSALRMIDMEAPGYLVASAVRAVLAQRLVRRICPECKEPVALAPQQQVWLESRYPQLSQHTFHYGRGCQSCNFSGYRGRIGVFELLEIDMPMMDALRDNNAVLFGQLARNSQSYKPLIESAMELAMAGTTSIDEVLILGESDNIDLVV